MKSAFKMPIMDSVMDKKTQNQKIMKKGYRTTEKGGIPFFWRERKRVIDDPTNQMTFKIDLKVTSDRSIFSFHSASQLPGHCSYMVDAVRHWHTGCTLIQGLRKLVLQVHFAKSRINKIAHLPPSLFPLWLLSISFLLNQTQTQKGRQVPSYVFLLRSFHF